MIKNEDRKKTKMAKKIEISKIFKGEMMILFLKEKIERVNIKTEKNKRYGVYLLQAFIGKFENRILLCRKVKIKKEIIPLIKGVKIQPMIINVILFQWIAFIPFMINPNPKIAPMIAWVVETGSFKKEATFSHSPVAMSAESIPIAKIKG